MKIALDYDGTYTADPTLWDYFISMCRARNHIVCVVTMRSAYEDKLPFEDDEYFSQQNVSVVFCDGHPKKDYCKTKYNLEFDIWIDDTPEGIHKGSTFTPVQLEAWRANGRK